MSKAKSGATRVKGTGPRAAIFDIATRGSGREPRKGYVLGDWATHKEPGRGVYFWSFTHIPTGLGLNVYPPHEKKDSALAHLEKLHRDGPNESTASIIGKRPFKWALGM